MSATAERSRDRVSTLLAVVMGLLSFSNLWKPVAQALAPESSAGFVFFGHRLEGLANAVMGPLFGLFLATYAYGVWNQKRWVVPVAASYAVYVVLNLILFAANAPPAEDPGLAFTAVYATAAIAVSAGGAIYLFRNRHRLR